MKIKLYSCLLGLLVSSHAFAQLKLEKLPMDRLTSTLKIDEYGRPDTEFTKDGYPILEFFNNSSWPDVVTIILYVRNVGNSGETKLTAEARWLEDRIATTKMLRFDGAKKYTIRIPIHFETVPSWGSEYGISYNVNMTIGSLKYSEDIRVPRAGSVSFNEVTVEPLPDYNNPPMSPGTPDKSWLQDSVWVCKYKYGVKPLNYVRLLSDGTVEYNNNSTKDFKATSKPSVWSITDGKLLISWNGGSATETYELNDRRALRYLGTHSGYSESTVFERIK